MPSARTSRSKTSTVSRPDEPAGHDEPAAGSAIADAAVFAEAASIAAGAQAEVAAEVATTARAAGVAATEKSITATAEAKGAAATAFATAQAAVAETAQILAATTRAKSVEAAVVAAAQTAAAQAAAVASAAVAAEAGWSAAMAMAHTTATLERRPISPAEQPTVGKALTRLAGLLDGLDEDVRREWEGCLSAAEAPITLPADGAGTDQAPPAPAGLRALVRDLTLARRIELALSEEEQRLRTTFDRAPVAMLRAAVDGGRLVRFLRVNAALCRLTGYPEAELMELDPRALRHPEAQTDQLDQHQVLRWMHAEGHNIWVRLSLSPVLNDDGRLNFVVGQVEDVTSQLRVEAALRRSEAQFRLVFDNAPVATMLVGLTGAQPAQLLRVNRAACRLTGYTEAELMAVDLEELLGRPTVHRVPTGELECRLRYRHADGHSFPGLLQGRVVAGENGRGDLLVAQIRDVSEEAAASPSG